MKNRQVNETPVAASCATYRKVNNKLAKALNIDPNHTQYPGEDFENLIDKMDEQNKNRVIEWYRRGLKRGFICATDQVVQKTLEFKNGTLYAPTEIKISVKLKLRGEPSQNEEFVFNAEELGFK